MQMLETIQEYVPFKHSFVYFSSWIGSKYGEVVSPSQKAEQNNDSEEQRDLSSNENDKEDSKENDDTVDPTNVELKVNGQNAEQIEASESEQVEIETKFIESAPSQESLIEASNGGENSRDRCLSNSLDNLSKDTKNDDENYQQKNGKISQSYFCKRGSLEQASKIESFLYNNIPIDGCSCPSDSENDQRKSDNGKLSKKRFGSFSKSIKVPLFLKGRRKKKRRGNTWNEYRSPVAKMCCDCAIGGGDLCLVHLKSQSESDINATKYKIGEEYFGDLSDISVTSFSLAEDDSSSDSYVDIDLRNVRRSLIDSGSWSKSDLSVQLSSDWSEIHRTISDPSLADDCLSLAEECRESDIPDTASDFSQDSRTHVSRFQKKRVHGRIKRLPMTGHHVNESFIENECFCHCIVM